jgi:hypothetical protein
VEARHRTAAGDALTARFRPRMHGQTPGERLLKAEALAYMLINTAMPHVVALVSACPMPLNPTEVWRLQAHYVDEMLGSEPAYALDDLRVTFDTLVELALADASADPALGT